MLSSIHPLGERGKGNRYGLTTGSYLLGSVLGGLAAGAVLAPVAELLGRLTGDAARLGAFAVVAGLGALAELRGWRLPSWQRQVNEDWLTTYRGWVYGAGFGLQLGAGAVTIVSTPAVHVTVAAAALSGSWTGAVAVLATFGIVRGASIFAAAGVDSPTALARVHERLHRRAGGVRSLSAGGLAVTAAAVATTIA